MKIAGILDADFVDGASLFQNAMGAAATEAPTAEASSEVTPLATDVP
jgi:hypothetical protein